MKKLILLSFLSFFASGILFAQITPEQKCATFTELQKVLDSDPELKEHYEAAELMSNSYAGTTMNNNKASQQFVVPVVFHILHTYGGENITDAQVYDALKYLTLSLMLQMVIQLI